MSWLDYLLLAVIGGYSLYLIFRKKPPRCGGNCADCHADCKGSSDEIGKRGG